MKEILDIVYKVADGQELMIDLFLPEAVEKPPLIFWIHGGAWMMGDRKWCGFRSEIERGYAVASVDYRLSTVAQFPAQIVDCKDALWFLKKNAEKYGFDPGRVCVAGDSAGGHLTALMGVSIGHADWEQPGADCSVQAVMDYYGPTTFLHGWQNEAKPGSPGEQLLGAAASSVKGHMLAAAANPITYVDGTEPPFLIVHGDKDDVVPIMQSLLLRDALEQAGVSVAMHKVFGGGHGFQSPAANAVAQAFLDYHLKP